MDDPNIIKKMVDSFKDGWKTKLLKLGSKKDSVKTQYTQMEEIIADSPERKSGRASSFCSVF